MRLILSAGIAKRAAEAMKNQSKKMAAERSWRP
jgi:hypothetical protein